MELKKSFIKNLSEIAPGMKQKEIARIMGCTEGTISKYLNPQKKDFPTVEMLYNLAQYFNISIDWLVGRSNPNFQYSEKLSLRDICKMLLTIYNAPYSGFLFGQISVNEECFMPDPEGHGTDHIKKNNTYPALYFSEWCSTNKLDETEYEIISQTGNDLPRMICINTFLSRLNEISDMKERGNLNQEMYDRLLESYLNDVPDN